MEEDLLHLSDRHLWLRVRVNLHGSIVVSIFREEIKLTSAVEMEPALEHKCGMRVLVALLTDLSVAVNHCCVFLSHRPAGERHTSAALHHRDDMSSAVMPFVREVVVLGAPDEIIGNGLRSKLERHAARQLPQGRGSFECKARGAHSTKKYSA